MSQIAAVRKTPARLADGRELTYSGSFADSPDPCADTRVLEPADASRRRRRDHPLLDEWVLITGHRMGRTHLPPDTECPLCPSRPGLPTEIPASWYQVAVFQNRFPALDPGGRARDWRPFRSVSPRGPAEGAVRWWSSAPITPLVLGPAPGPGGHRRGRVGGPHRRAFPPARRPAGDRFENRGAEIGVTLSHPHGQMYAYPFITPRMSRMLGAVRAYRDRTGRDLVDDVITAERADGSRIVVAGRHWTAFVPFAARWPYEIHLTPPAGCRN